MNSPNTLPGYWGCKAFSSGRYYIGAQLVEAGVETWYPTPNQVPAADYHSWNHVGCGCKMSYYEDPSIDEYEIPLIWLDADHPKPVTTTQTFTCNTAKPAVVRLKKIMVAEHVQKCASFTIHLLMAIMKQTRLARS